VIAKKKFGTVKYKLDVCMATSGELGAGEEKISSCPLQQRAFNFCVAISVLLGNIRK
jgi:hypothetical protein